jgi:hypothetical protein
LAVELSSPTLTSSFIPLLTILLPLALPDLKHGSVLAMAMSKDPAEGIRLLGSSSLVFMTDHWLPLVFGRLPVCRGFVGAGDSLISFNSQQ